MSQANLTLVFDGPAVLNGEIDVQDLAPALLAMGDLIQAANTEINGIQAQISVRVRATGEGSFEVDLSLIQSWVTSLLNFAKENKEGVVAANDLADLLFKVTGGVGALGGGLWALIKFLKGRKPDKTEQKGGDVHIHVGDNIFITNNYTIQLAQSVSVREQAKRAIAVLSRGGIDTIKIKRPLHEDLEVKKEETGYFEYEYDDAEEELSDENRTMTLQIISLSFKEDNKWRVTDGGDPFNVTIDDTVFLNQIANNQISFSKGDYLLCDVREQQFRSSKGLKKERSITQVIEHKSAARQLKLF